MTRQCQADEPCNKKVIARGLCDCHYRMWRIYGRTTRIRRKWGTGTIRPDGYKQISRGDGTLVMEHVYMVEEILKKRLPPEAVIHHVNGERADNYTPFNLVVCPDQEYHMLLHSRSEELGYFPKTWSRLKQREKWRERHATAGNKSSSIGD